MDYKTSGVDIEAGREFVSEIKQAVEGTHTSNVIEGISGFGSQIFSRHNGINVLTNLSL